jgi:penicillin-binding protein-related factor A (putative recombinase)
MTIKKTKLKILMKKIEEEQIKYLRKIKKKKYFYS